MTASSPPPAPESSKQAPGSKVDLEALAREILELLKEELRIENERQGRA